MKNLMIALLLGLTGTAQARDLSTYICKENLPFTEFEMLRTRYVIKIQEKEDISSINKEVDNAFLSEVTISTEDEHGGHPSVIKSFPAISTNSDVYYEISSKPNGFEFNMYLDELEESSMSIINNKGVTRSVRLSCESI